MFTCLIHSQKNFWRVGRPKWLTFQVNRFNSSNGGVVVSNSTSETSWMQIDIPIPCKGMLIEGGWESSGLFQLSSRWAKELPFFGGLNGNRIMTIGPFTNQLNKSRKSNQRRMKGYYIWIRNDQWPTQLLNEHKPNRIHVTGRFIMEKSPNAPKVRPMDPSWDRPRWKKQFARRRAMRRGLLGPFPKTWQWQKDDYVHERIHIHMYLLFVSWFFMYVCIYT